MGGKHHVHAVFRILLRRIERPRAINTMVRFFLRFKRGHGGVRRRHLVIHRRRNNPVWKIAIYRPTVTTTMHADISFEQMRDSMDGLYNRIGHTRHDNRY